MEDQNMDLPNKPLSPDPEENLRLENELLRLKLQAERGAFFSDFSEAIPSEIENEFLRNIQRIEENWEQEKLTTVYELIGKPAWINVTELNPDEIQAALDKMFGLLKSKNIDLHVEGEYPPAVIYEFITEEFFRHEIMPVIVPGFIQGYIYEEFHPNHTRLIEKAANDFVDHWFRKGFNDYNIELGDRFITIENRQFTRDEVLNRLSVCLDRYLSFSDPLIRNKATSFEWKDGADLGLGFAEGRISYEAMLENGETVRIEGPYKLYMSYESVHWQIFNFQFPGFSW